MMRHYMPALSGTGVLLSYYSEVHRNAGGRTKCGHPAPAGRVAPVTDVQAMVYQLGLCSVCYPDRNNPRVAGRSRVGR